MTTIESSPEIAVDTTSDPTSESESAAGRLLDAIADWLSSTDHKRIGRLYLAGGMLGLVAVVAVNVLLAVERIDGADTALDSGALPQLVDAQRVGFVFAVLLPLAMAASVAFVPLQLGARAIAFPRLAACGLWMWFGGLVLVTVALTENGGTLGSDSRMVDLFIASLGLMALGLIATAVSVATSILTTRAPGMTMRRVPAFSWSALVFSLGTIVVLPVFVGTITYLFLDHRNGRTGFGGNSGITGWAGWIFTQPATYLFAIPAIGLLAELAPVTFNKRTPARGVMFAGISLVGMAAFAAVTQQDIQQFEWSEAGDRLDDLVPWVLFDILPILGVLIVLLVVLAIAKPERGMRPKLTPGMLFGLFGFLMILVGMIGNALYSIDSLDLQGTIFEEATTIFIVYGAVLATMGAVIYWAPKLWGRSLGVAKTVPLALLGVLATVLAALPHYISGFLDQPAGLVYDNGDLQIWNILVLVGHGLMALTVIAFIGLLLGSTTGDGEDVGDDPWDAQTIEWSTTSPAPRDNFVDVPVLQSAEPMLDLRAANQPTGSTTDGSDA